MAITREITFDIVKQTEYAYIEIPQGDNIDRIIYVNLIEDSSSYVIPSTASVRFEMAQSDGSIIYNNCQVTDNKIELTITPAISSLVGRHPATFRIIDSTTGGSLRTFRFHMLIKESAYSDELVVNTGEFTALQDLELRVGDVSSYTSSCEAATNACIEATNNVGVAITNAETATTNATNAANLANEKAGLADTAISNANTATQNAITATENANTEISEMNTLESNVSATEIIRQNYYNAYKVFVDWNNSTQFYTYNHVYHNGSTYEALVDNITHEPPEDGDTTWKLVAKHGVDGTGGDMVKSIYDTANKATDIYSYADNNIIVSNQDTVGSGVLYNSGLVVSAQSTPDMTVSVSTGTAYLTDGKRYTPTANTSLAITTADTTNPRIDIVYVNSSGVISYLAGTASATPTAPSLPSGGILLSEISVISNATTITSNDITDKRTIIKSNTDLDVAINEAKESININISDIGDKTLLNTTDKSSLVGAINEIKNNISTDYNMSISCLAKRSGTVVYNPTMGLLAWKSTLSDLKTSSTDNIINIQLLNDSIGEGYGSGENGKGWADLLRTYFESKFQNVGYGVIPYYQYSYYPTKYWTFTGTWVEGNSYGFCNKNIYTSSAGATATLTFNGTGIDIYCARTISCGQISVIIDGGTPIILDTNLSTEQVAGKVSITGLVDGSHVMVITKIDDSKFFFLFGACPLKGSRGVRINTVGLNGGSTTSIIASTNALIAEIDIWTPKLTIIELFANDIVSLTPSVYKTQMQTIITRAKTFGDVVLFPTGIRDDTSYTHKIPEFISVLKELYIYNNVCLIDAYNYFGGNFEFANTNLGVLSDVVHPNAKGHQDLFELIANVII